MTRLEVSWRKMPHAGSTSVYLKHLQLDEGLSVAEGAKDELMTTFIWDLFSIFAHIFLVVNLYDSFGHHSHQFG